MRVVANWIPPHRRGKMIGIIGTSYQLTAALTFVVSGWSAHWLGWRGAFYVPSALLALAALHMLLFLRERPTGHGGIGFQAVGEDSKHRQAGSLSHATGHAEATAATAPAQATWQDNVIATIANPALWFVAVSLALLDACRYGFTDWGLTHLKEVQGTHVGTAALKYAVLPAGGIAGALVAGWATDRFFQGRRAPVIAGLLVLLGLLALVYDAVARTSLGGTIVVLMAIGFCIFGPQVLLVGTAPADFAKRGTAAAAAGFVNFMGYLGAFAGDWVTGYVAGTFGWAAAVQCWAGFAFAAALAAACLWNAKAR
jgi:sugar phosphate permease